MGSADLVLSNQEKELEIEKSRARKERLLAKESQARARAPKSEMTIEAQGKADEVRAHAAKTLIEQQDEVKKMNSMILYAKCVAIRDAQVNYIMNI